MTAKSGMKGAEASKDSSVQCYNLSFEQLLENFESISPHNSWIFLF